MEDLWRHNRPADKREEIVTPNVRYLMRSIMSPLAKFLVKQKLDDGTHAAAPFNLYTFEPGSNVLTALKILFEAAKAADDTYKDVLTKMDDAVGKLKDIGTAPVV